MSEARRPDERRYPIRIPVSIIRLGSRLLYRVSVRVPDKVARRGLRWSTLQAFTIKPPQGIVGWQYYLTNLINFVILDGRGDLSTRRLKRKNTLFFMEYELTLAGIQNNTLACTTILESAPAADSSTKPLDVTTAEITKTRTTKTILEVSMMVACS